MRPIHLFSFGRMLIKTFSPLFSAMPQRLPPHGSIRTLPLFSSVAQRPSGELGSLAAAETGAGCAAAAGGAIGTGGAIGSAAAVPVTGAGATGGTAGVGATPASGRDATA